MKMSESYIDCQAVQMQLDAWLTHELDDDYAAVIKAHLDSCVQCRSFLCDLEGIRKQVSASQGTVGPSMDKLQDVIVLAVKQRQKVSFSPQWLLRAAYILVGLLLFQVLDMPLASRLFTVGVVLNICGLLVLPFVARNELGRGRA